MDLLRENVKKHFCVEHFSFCYKETACSRCDIEMNLFTKTNNVQLFCSMLSCKWGFDYFLFKAKYTWALEYFFEIYKIRTRNVIQNSRSESCPRLNGYATLLVILAIERPDGLAGGEVLVVIVVLLPLNDHLDLPRLRVRHYTIREHYRETY